VPTSQASTAGRVDVHFQVVPQVFREAVTAETVKSLTEPGFLSAGRQVAINRGNALKLFSASASRAQSVGPSENPPSITIWAPVT
jgi:hypothetical protein